MKIIKELKEENIKNIDIYRKAARGIILNKNKALMIYSRYFNDYSFPGGGLEKNEDILDTLKREVLEETGYIVSDIKEYGLIIETKEMFNKNYYQENYYFLCKGNRVTNPDLEDYEIEYGYKPLWIDLKKAYNHNLNTLKNKYSMAIKRENEIIEKLLEEL